MAVKGFWIRVMEKVIIVIMLSYAGLVMMAIKLDRAKTDKKA